MSTVILQASLPWSVSYEEDRRFRRILLQTLAACLLVGTITHNIPIPEPDISDMEELPPRRVYLLEEQIKPAPKPLRTPVAPVVTAPVKPKPRPEPLPAPPKETPRQKAASSGVLAMSDALAELHSKAPKTETGRVREGAADEVNAIPIQPAMLTANLSRGSKGIEGGIEHQSVLGATGLPERVHRQQDDASRGGGAARGRISAPPSAVRSEEEIQEILDRNKGAIYTLYNRELRRDDTLQGKMVMSITIAPSGKVTRCSTLSNEVGSLALERQLIALLQRIDFGDKPGVPIVTTRIPIEFFPI